jgi:hypothetical protein
VRKRRTIESDLGGGGQKEENILYLKVLLSNVRLTGGTEEKQDKPQSSVAGTTFTPDKVHA